MSASVQFFATMCFTHFVSHKSSVQKTLHSLVAAGLLFAFIIITVTTCHSGTIMSRELRSYPLITGGSLEYSKSSLLSLAEHRHRRRNIILLIVSNESLELALNWCISNHRVHIHNYILVALDLASHSFLASIQAPVVAISKTYPPFTRSDVWIRRSALAQILLQNGFNVLISDADAIAMRSPFSDRVFNSSLSSFDIIASPSNFPNPLRGELPKECLTLSKSYWRHQPCMGWIFFRSSAKMMSFFSELFLPKVIKYADDQIGLACALRYAGESVKHQYSWSWTQNTVIRFLDPPLRLLMLPAALYVRNCTKFKQDRLKNYGIRKFDMEKVSLFHCKGWDKRANAENNGVWYIREDWDEIAVSKYVPFREYLQRIATQNSTKEKTVLASFF